MVHYVDIHTHVNINAFKDDWKEVVERARRASVAHINVGTQIDTSKRAVEIAEAFENDVYAVVGLHPVHTSASYHDEKELGSEHKGFTSRGEQFDISNYKELAKHPKVVALGECGLDYYRLDSDSIERQRHAFIAQIELANEVGKPLMLHIRPSTEQGAPAAYKDAFHIVNEYAKVRGNVHFFAGTVEEAKRFWDIGFSTSFTGVVTFTSDYDEVVRLAPRDLIHAETDAPYVTPKPHRGRRNEPLYVPLVVQRMAEIRNEDEEELRKQLLQNAQELFGIEV